MAAVCPEAAAVLHATVWGSDQQGAAQLTAGRYAKPADPQAQVHKTALHIGASVSIS